MRWTSSLRALVALVPLALLAQVASGEVVVRGNEKSASGKLYEFRVDGVRFDGVETSAGKFQKAQLTGVQGYDAVRYREGEPELPVIRFFADGDVAVEVDADKATYDLSGAQIVPNQPPRIKLPSAAPAFQKSIKAYQSHEMLPAQPYEITEAGSVNGVPRYLVTLYPMAYAPAEQRYVLRRSFKVRVKQAVTPRQVGMPEAMVFIVGKKFENSPSLAVYAALKESLGYTVDYVVVEKGDSADKIRAAVKAIYARPSTRLTHAIIIGEADDVPGKDSNNISGWTDHYYAAIDTDNYDSDISAPDIGIGRVSVRNEAQLETVLAKFTRYQNGAFTGEHWLNDVSFIATDDRYEVAEGSHNYVIQNYTAPHGYQGVFPRADMQGGDQLYAITHHASTEQVFNAMNQGRTIISYSGHGSNTTWAGPTVTQDDVRRLSDVNALPFVVSNACITGDYRVEESFAETWERHPAGSIVFWGSMDSTYWDEDDILERAMYDAIYRDGKLRFTDHTHYALSEMWRHYGGAGKSKYYWETYHVFGDPELDLRTTATKSVSIAGPEVLPLGVGEVSYTVTDDSGAAVKGARVALSIPGRRYHLNGVTDQGGLVRFDIANAARDVVTMKLTVSGRNAQLKSSDLKIIPADAPFLSLAQFLVNDRAQMSASPGELASLGFSVSNLGQRPTQGARVWIEGVEGPATVVASEAAVPALAARDVRRIDDGQLRVALTEAAQSGDSIRVKLAWATKEGQSGQNVVVLKVTRASLAVDALNFGSPDVEGIRPGETGTVYLTVKNTGTETIRNARLEALPGACVAGVGSKLAVAELAPGASVQLAEGLVVRVDENCENGQDVNLILRGVYASAARELALDAEISFPAGVLSTQVADAGTLNVAIPDDGPEISEQLDVTSTGVVKDVGLYVKLSHTYIGDLTLKLVHPDGTEILLHDRSGGSTANIDKTYGFGGEAVPALAQLVGKRAEGAWQVRVQDHAGQDTGTLQGVKLTVKGYLN